MKKFNIAKGVTTLFACLTMASTIQAQFQLSGQYMSRGEYRHGFQTLADTGQKGTYFVSQRTRINGEYKSEKYRIFASVQDIRTWGSVANAAIDNKGLLSLFEGYGELYLTKKFTAKVGRQAISYDDDRIFGGLDWAMQARRHDALVLKYTDSTWTLHAGAAYNQNAESYKLTQYSVTGNYKAFQYLWFNKKIDKFDLSALLLNNGYAHNRLNGITNKKDSMTLYTQTIGLRGEYKAEKLNGLLYAYYQRGDDASNKTVSAYNIAAEVGYKPVKDLQLTLGGEMISGTSQTDTANKINHSFNPFYGTNHRFNGYMDYFYVGNHTNSVGLIDGFFKIHYTYKKLLVGLNSHLFMAAADVRNKKVLTKIEAMDPMLGTEIDFTFSYNFTDGVSVQGGYSQMFATETMVAIKGGSTAATSNWAYVMLILRPGKVTWPKVGLKM